MQLIGGFRSPYARRVAIALKIYGLPWEQVARSPWTDPDDVRRVNPVGCVPALVLDDGEVLVESAAILDYLDELAGPRALTPAAGAERRRVKQLEAIAITAIDKGVAAFYELTRKAEDKRDPAWAARCDGQVVTALGLLEQAAGAADPWFLGAPLTQADLTVGVAVVFLRMARPDTVDDAALPGLARLVARLDDVPAFAATAPPPA